MNDTSVISGEKLLSDVRDAVSRGVLTREQILAAAGVFDTASVHRGLSLQKIFYIIGGLIFVIGVGLLVGQFWGDMGKPLRVVLTLGLSAAFYAAGYIFFKKSESRAYGRIAFILFIFLLPLGVGTFLDLIGFSVSGNGSSALLSALVLIPYVVSWVALREPFFFYAAIFSASALFVFLTNMFWGGLSPAYDAYRALVIGISYVTLARWVKERATPEGPLHALGLLIIFAASLALAADRSYGLWLFWTLLYPLLLAGCFWASVRLQSRDTLIVGALFTVAYIAYLTATFFADTIGWPFAIILAGGVIMAIGYFSFRINRQYLKRS